MLLSGKSKKAIILGALATIFSLVCYDVEVTGGFFRSMNDRSLSLHYGNGTCEWRPAIQWTDNGFPSDTTFTKSIIAGYPSGDKCLTYLQLEGLTGLSARDEWDFKFLAHTNQPFIKANYPHHEGIWGWGNVGDQVLLVVSDLKRVLVEYHDILWVSSSVFALRYSYVIEIETSEMVLTQMKLSISPLSMDTYYPCRILVRVADKITKCCNLR